MSRLTISGVEINYEDIGHGHPLIMQHGLGGSVAAITSLYEPTDGVRLLTFDFPGHGDSEFPGDECFSFEYYAQLTKAFMDALGIDKAVLGGVSMGAANALHTALLFPERVQGLVLIRPAWHNAPMSDEVREVFEKLHSFMNTHDGKRCYLESALHERMKRDYPRLDSSFEVLFDYPRAAETSQKYIKMPLDCPNTSAKQLLSVNVPAIVAATGRDMIHPLEYGKALACELPNAGFFEAVSKSDDAALHTAQIRELINGFMKKLYGSVA